MELPDNAEQIQSYNIYFPDTPENLLCSYKLNTQLLLPPYLFAGVSYLLYLQIQLEASLYYNYHIPR